MKIENIQPMPCPQCGHDRHIIELHTGGNNPIARVACALKHYYGPFSDSESDDTQTTDGLINGAIYWWNKSVIDYEPPPTGENDT